MTRVIAYTYQADVHTPEAALQDWQDGRLNINNTHPHAFTGLTADARIDENGLPYNLQDADGNLIHPVFDTDEGEV